MSATTQELTAKGRLVRGIVVGAIGGIVASVFMGMYAMVASYLKDTGFFTPLHHIASLFAAPDAMMESMMGAMEQGDAFIVTAGTAILGLIIHMMVGAMYGAIFGAVAALLSLDKLVIIGLGVVWGGIVFVISAFIGLPLAAAVFGVGDLPDGMNPVADMAQMAGWGVFFTEHLLFGLVLGVIVAFGSVGAAVKRG